MRVRCFRILPNNYKSIIRLQVFLEVQARRRANLANELIYFLLCSLLMLETPSYYYYRPALFFLLQVVTSYVVLMSIADYLVSIRD